MKRADLFANSLGLMTTALPAARAGAAFQIGIANGKFQGVIRPATPYGLRRESIKFGLCVGIDVPSGSRVALAKYWSIAIARAHSPRASEIGL